MIDTKKQFFSAEFLGSDFFNTVKVSDMANWFLKRASIPKTTRPFSGGVIGNFFEDILVFSVKLSTWCAGHTPKV
jgi:hypothetical protein